MYDFKQAAASYPTDAQKAKGLRCAKVHRSRVFREIFNYLLEGVKPKFTTSNRYLRTPRRIRQTPVNCGC